MRSLLNYLNKNKLPAWGFLVIYYLLVVLLHQQVSNLFLNMFEGVPRNVYQTTVLLVGSVLLLIYVLIIIRNIIIREWRRMIIFYLFFSLVFVVLSFEIIIIHNIEIIHFAQYAGIAILLFPILRRFGDTVFWATILGFFDEAYQYLYLKPDGTDYFDFNDVILNVIGTGLGLILIFSNGFQIYRLELRKWYKSVSNISAMVFIIGICVLFFASVIQLYPSDAISENHFILVKVKDVGFWRFVNPTIGRFHVVRPLEGTIIIIILMMFYFTMDRVAKTLIIEKS